MEKQNMNKYKIQLSMFGLVAERAHVTIEAENEKEARDKVLEMTHDGEIEFTNNQECVDGWEYQIEDLEIEE